MLSLSDFSCRNTTPYLVLPGIGYHYCVRTDDTSPADTHSTLTGDNRGACADHDVVFDDRSAGRGLMARHPSVGSPNGHAVVDRYSITDDSTGVDYHAEAAVQHTQTRAYRDGRGHLNAVQRQYFLRNPPNRPTTRIDQADNERGVVKISFSHPHSSEKRHSRSSLACSRYHSTVEPRPPSRLIFAVQPASVSLETSSSFWGVPSGFDVSHLVSPS
jgi:hypothetical protein